MIGDRWRMFALGGATLMFEVLLTRIAAVTLFANLAFAVIAVSLFGLAVGSAWAERVRFGSEDDRERTMRRALLAAAAFTLLAGLLATKLPLVPTELTAQGKVVSTFTTRRSVFDDDPSQAHWRFIALVTFAQAAPFALAGYVQALALGRPHAQVRVLYAFDLAGATIGSLATIALLRRLGAVDALGVVSVLFVGAAMPRRTHERVAGGVVVLGAALVLLLRPFDITYAAGFSEKGVVAVDWSALARIALLHDDLLVVDNTSVTEVAFAHDRRFDGNLERVPYLLRPDGDVLVIGAGGGQEIETALATAPERHRHVDAIELADGEERLMRSVYGKRPNFLLDEPGVEYRIADGRSFLETARRTWDVIQMKEVNFHSFAGQAASAWSPNLLFTVEAFRLDLARLSPHGLFALTKGMYANDVAPTNEILAALHAASPDLSTRLVIVDRPRPLGRQRLFLVAKEPFTDDELASIKRIEREIGLRTVRTPRERDDAFEAMITGDATVATPTDDRPFGQGTRQRTDHQMLSIAVVVIGLLVVVLAAWSLRRVPASKRTIATGQLGICALLGVGFMLLEVVLVERTSLLLGHPTIAFAAVLTSLLCALGAGSILSEGLTRKTALLVLLVVIALGVAPDLAGGALRALGPKTRIGAVTIGLFVGAVPLGMLLPNVIRLARETNGATPAACWSVNAAASVLGTLAAALLVRTHGFHVTSYGTWLAYALAIVLWLGLSSSASATTIVRSEPRNSTSSSSRASARFSLDASVR